MANKKNNKKTDNKVKKANIFTRTAAFFKDDKFQFITGLLLVVAAIYLLIAFTSYIVLNGADQSAIETGASVGIKNAGLGFAFDFDTCGLVELHVVEQVVEIGNRT